MEKQRFVLLVCSVIFLVSTAEVVGADAGAGNRDLAHHLITKAGTSRGLWSLLGCRGGTLALELVRGSQSFLHVQDPRGATIADAQKTLDVDGLYGTRVLAERKPLDLLAFADNTVDVVFAPLGAGTEGHRAGASHKLEELSMKQILRVLRPGGRAVIGTVKSAEQQVTEEQLSQWIIKDCGEKISFRFGHDAFGTWMEITKPQPAFRQRSIASIVSVTVPSWLSLIRTALAASSSIPRAMKRVLVTKRSSPTIWIFSPSSRICSLKPSQSFSSSPSSMETIG